MDIYKIEFGKKLRAALDKVGFTQSEFSEKINVKPATVSRWVNGHDFPNDSRLSEICSILSVDHSYFIPKEHKSPPTVEALLEALSKLQKEKAELERQIGNIPLNILALLAKADKTQREMIERILTASDDDIISEAAKKGS